MEQQDHPEIVVDIRVSVKPQTIADIIDTAGYGIGYWAELAHFDEDARTYTVRVQEEMDDRPEHERTKVLTYQDIANAMGVIVSGKAGVANPIVEMVRDGLLDGDAAQVDSDAADVIIQIAALEELVYG